MDVFEKLHEFHNAFGASIGTTDFHDKNSVELRKNLIQEEHKEVLLAFENQNKENLLKEICDAVYVLVGTAVAFGWDFNEAFRRVHESNISKLGEDGKPVFRQDGKVLKGPNYKPAVLEDLV